MLRFNPVLFCLLFFCANASAQDYDEFIKNRITALQSAGVDTILLYESKIFGPLVLHDVNGKMCDPPVFLLWRINGVTSVQKLQDCYDENAESYETVAGEVMPVNDCPVIPWLAENFGAIIQGELMPAIMKSETDTGYYYSLARWNHPVLHELKVYLKDTVFRNIVNGYDLQEKAAWYMINLNYAYNRTTKLAHMISLLDGLVTELYSTEPWFKQVDGVAPSKDSVIIVEVDGRNRYRQVVTGCVSQHTRYLFWQRNGKTYCQNLSVCYITPSFGSLKSFSSKVLLLGNSKIFNFLDTTFGKIRAEEIKHFSTGDGNQQRIEEIMPSDSCVITFRYGKNSLEKRFSMVDFSKKVDGQGNINFSANNSLKLRQFILLLFDIIQFLEQNHQSISY